MSFVPFVVVGTRCYAMQCTSAYILIGESNKIRVFLSDHLSLAKVSGKQHSQEVERGYEWH